MPQIKSAAKRLRQNAKARKRNRAALGRIKTTIREFRQQIEAGKAEDARQTLTEVYSLLDRGQGRGFIKRNYVSRQKSRLSAKLNSLDKAD